jgi:hypothetical protein
MAIPSVASRGAAAVVEKLLWYIAVGVQRLEYSGRV